jgi:hypothetical protein
LFLDDSNSGNVEFDTELFAPRAIFSLFSGEFDWLPIQKRVFRGWSSRPSVETVEIELHGFSDRRTFLFLQLANMWESWALMLEEVKNNSDSEASGSVWPFWVDEASEEPAARASSRDSCRSA